jgi:two-component system sensor histidine kinase RegB
MPLSALAEASAAPHRKDGVEVSVEIEPANRLGATGDGIGSEGGQPVVARNPEILHGLGNLIENAVDFAESRVALLVGWSENEISIDLEDDGPGFDRGILGALGEPYVTTRREADGMGLGVFIAKTLLEHTGARVVFSNRGGGGARVAITWPRAILEQDEV